MPHFTPAVKRNKNARSQINYTLGESVWSSGKALVRLVSRRATARFRFGSPFSSERLWFVDTVLIIMYVYHALIDALRAHMIYLNLNMIFYTHTQSTVPPNQPTQKHHTKRPTTPFPSPPHTNHNEFKCVQH